MAAVSRPVRAGLRLALVLAALAGGACGSTPEAVIPATTPRSLAATPEQISLKPGDTGSARFELRGPTGALLPGQQVTFAIVDSPDTPGVEAQGATLTNTVAVTDAAGIAEARVTAGMPTIFAVRASSANATAEVSVLVAADGAPGAVDVAPFFVVPAGRAASVAATIQVYLYVGDTCAKIPQRGQPRQTRFSRSIPAGNAVVRYNVVNAPVSYAILGRALDPNGAVRAIGCTDLPGPALVAGGTVQVPLALADVGPDPAGSYAATSELEIAPPLAAAETIAATWRDLTDCALDPAQVWLDCTIDALGGASDADPLDCVPATAPGGDGALGDALGALRGAFLSGPDGKPTACRGSKTTTGTLSADATAMGLFGSPLPLPLVRLEAAADDAARLFDDTKLRSTMEIQQGATARDVVVSHTLTELVFTVPGATSEVALQALGLPVLSAVAAGSIDDDDVLTIAQHGFTVRLGTAAREAFGTLGLSRRGLPPTTKGLVAAIAALAHSDDQALAGCAALDAALCPRLLKDAGCLMVACGSGLDALATRLTRSFDVADGQALDLYLAGRTPLLDPHNNGMADRLGDLQVPSQEGTWTVDLRPQAGRRTVTAQWEAVRQSR